MKHRHRYVYESPRGFANEFVIYVVPESWKVASIFSFSKAGRSLHPITRKKAVESLRGYRGKDSRRSLYACPVCGYVPEGVAAGEVERPWWSKAGDLKAYLDNGSYY